MRSLLARLFSRSSQPEHTCRIIRTLRQDIDPAGSDHGTPIQIHSWEFQVRDHFRFASASPETTVNSHCGLCGSIMIPLTQVENREGKTSLETGYCTDCDFIQHTKRPPWRWAAQHFRTGWLRDRPLPQRVAPNDNVLREVAPVLPSRATVLDLGCGNGDKLMAFAKAGHDCHGAEPSEREVDLAQREFGNRIFLGTAEEYLQQFPDRKYDLVYFCGVLSFIERPFDVLRKCLNNLNPGGFIYVDVPRYNSGPWNVFFNSHLYIRPSIFSVRSMKRFAYDHHMAIRIGKTHPLGILLRKDLPIPIPGLEPNTDLSLAKIYDAMNEQLHFQELHQSKMLRLWFQRLGMTVQVSLGSIKSAADVIADRFPIRFIHDTAEPPVLLK